MVLIADLLIVQVLLPQLITQFEQLTTLLPSCSTSNSCWPISQLFR